MRYSCRRGWLDKGQPRCIAFGGTRADAAFAEAVLQVVQPAAIEAAMVAREEETLKQDEVLAALQRDQQAARYAAQRAQKQYDAADPENRLVADELERAGMMRCCAWRKWNRVSSNSRAHPVRHRLPSPMSLPILLQRWNRSGRRPTPD
ncbi:hypothetical protein [Paraburkholderia sediminicola]|uniref:hypothetical protein n=1 Tax=Paraburkholderia sediminicola TaxID=458836 RepID=UPI0038BE055F